jgi:hypothetical protein
MTQVGVGDRVIHYAKGVRAISTVTAVALDTLRPQELPEAWGSDGRLVRCAYGDAAPPVGLDLIPLAWRLGEKGGPFRYDGKVNQGYLYPLSDEFAARFMAQFGTRFDAGSPAAVLPAEALETATDLLRRLIGVTITTVDGSPNRVLSVVPPTVLVGTERSPGGAPVPIEDVQQALDRLRAAGAVTITPSDVGYRSAFVGAVLLTLPGARAAGSPPVIGIDPATTDDRAVITFDGDLDRPRDTAERGEQARLRRSVGQRLGRGLDPSATPGRGGSPGGCRVDAGGRRAPGQVSDALGDRPVGCPHRVQHASLGALASPSTHPAQRPDRG